MRLPARRGFTLVELLVAVLLIDVGVLAMVAGTAVITRRQNAMRVRAAAAQIAANRIQHLTAGGCVATTGSIANQWNNEYFSATIAAPAVRELRDSVVFSIDGAPHAIVIRSRVSC